MEQVQVSYEEVLDILKGRIGELEIQLATSTLLVQKLQAKISELEVDIPQDSE